MYIRHILTSRIKIIIIDALLREGRGFNLTTTNTSEVRNSIINGSLI